MASAPPFSVQSLVTEKQQKAIAAVFEYLDKHSDRAKVEHGRIEICVTEEIYELTRKLTYIQDGVTLCITPFDEELKKRGFSGVLLHATGERQDDPSYWLIFSID